MNIKVPHFGTMSLDHKIFHPNKVSGNIAEVQRFG